MTLNSMIFLIGSESKLCLFGTAFFNATMVIMEENKEEYIKRRCIMETRVAVISIIIEEPESVEKMNEILHQYSDYVIGRMGIPYRKKGINIVSIAIDAPQDAISTLSGKIGKLSGVSSKVAYSNVKNK